MKGFEDGDLDYAARRAAYGPSNDPEPDYMSIALRTAASSPMPRD